MGNGRSLHIVGAGIIGVACALRLQLHGYRVTLIDPNDPGMGCSYGNAGIIQIGACVPVATPGVLRDILHMLLNSDQPLAIRWPYVLHLLPYLARFLAAARSSQVERITQILANTLNHAIDGFAPLLKAADAEHLFTKKRVSFTSMRRIGRSKRLSLPMSYVAARASILSILMLVDCAFWNQHWGRSLSMRLI